MAIQAMSDPRGYPSDEQVEKALNGCKNLRDYIMLRILSRTGIRISELLNIYPKDILMAEKQIIIKQLKKKSEKGVFRNAYIDVETCEILKEYIKIGNIAPEERLFNICRQQFSKILKHISLTSGVGNIGNKKWLHAHHLRHYFVMKGIKKGVDIRKLQMLVGHSSYSTTAGYMMYGSKELKDDYDKMFE